MWRRLLVRGRISKPYSGRRSACPLYLYHGRPRSWKPPDIRRAVEAVMAH